MDFFTQLVELFAKCIRETAERESLFWAMAIASAVAGLVAGFICAYSARLWNKKFQLKAVHYMLSGMAGICAVCCTILLFSAVHIPEAADKAIQEWESKITNDRDWIENDLGRRIFEAVDNIIPQPPLEKRKMQWSTLVDQNSPLAPDAGHAMARVLATDSMGHFKQNHRYLSWLLWLDKEGPTSVVEDRIATEMKISHGVAYVVALGWTAEQITEDLKAQSDRLVTQARSGIVMVLLVGEVFCLGWIGLAAYRDLKVRV